MWAVWPNRNDDIKCIEDDTDDVSNVGLIGPMPQGELFSLSSAE
jgi:hypothetical protein